MRKSPITGAFILFACCALSDPTIASAQQRSDPMRLPDTPIVFKPVPHSTLPAIAIPGSPNASWIPPKKQPPDTFSGIVFQQDPCAIPEWLKEDMQSIRVLITTNLAVNDKAQFEQSEKGIAKTNCHRKLWTYYVKSLPLVFGPKAVAGAQR